MAPLPVGIIGHRASGNIGDAVQAYALLELLDHHIDQVVDRNDLSAFQPSESGILIVNGWLTQRPEGLVPSPRVGMRFISIHLAADAPPYSALPPITDMLSASDACRPLFADSGPIGARDLHTLDLLRSLGVDAYFSGCLTLQLRKRPGAQEHGAVLAVDVHREAIEAIRSRIRTPVIEMSSASQDAWLTPEAIRASAEPFLDLIAGSRVVVTTRLHAALPAMAMGVPVIFAPPDSADPRLGGLLPFVSMTVDQAALSTLPVSAFEAPWPDALRHPSELRPDVDQWLGSIRSELATGVRHATSFSASHLELAAAHADALRALKRARSLEEEIGVLRHSLATVTAEAQDLRSRLQAMPSGPLWRLALKAHAHRKRRGPVD